MVGGGTTAPKAGVTTPTGGGASALLKPRPVGSAIPGGACKKLEFFHESICHKKIAKCFTHINLETAEKHIS